MNLEPTYTFDSKIKIKPENFITNIHTHDVDIMSNEIYLLPVDYDLEKDEGGVDLNMANRFIKNMNLCRKVNPDKNIIVHMNTNGGDFNQGMAIYDSIKLCPVQVIALNYSHARSMSSIIILAADKKVTMPHGTYMIHEGTMAFDGTYKGYQTYGRLGASEWRIMEEIYVGAMRDKKFLKNDSERRRWIKTRMDKHQDYWLTAQEAIEAGFFDEIFNGDWKKLGII